MHETTLIGYAGKDNLKDAFDELSHSKSELLEFIAKFRDQRGLNHERIRPVLPLLKLGGMSTKDISVEVRRALIEIMKRQIQSLEQEQLDALLDKCYSFLTVKQLAPIGIAVLEKLSFVDIGIWSQIVQNGLDEPPYTDLPISIKKRIWAAEPKAFEYEVEQVINRIQELPLPQSIEQFLIRLDRKKIRAEDLLLKDIIRLASNVDTDLLLSIVEQLVNAAKNEENPSKRVAISNFFFDFVLQFPAGNHNFASIRKMARYMDNFDFQATMDPAPQLETIYMAIKKSASMGMLTLLITSTYARDFLAHLLVVQLLNSRGPILDPKDESLIKVAGDHLRNDPWLAKLTFLCLCNIRSKEMLRDGKIPTDEEVDLPFQIFYPLLINEMELDVTTNQDQFYTANSVLPNEKFLDMVTAGNGVERRVVTTYCLQLYVHRNPVGLSRFRLVLDSAFKALDKTEEVREAALSYGLVMKVIADTHPQRMG